MSVILSLNEAEQSTRAGKLMRLDFFLIIIGILLAVAMVLTLLYGKQYSLHGYGSKLPATQVHPVIYPV